MHLQPGAAREAANPRLAAALARVVAGKVPADVARVANRERQEIAQLRALTRGRLGGEEGEELERRRAAERRADDHRRRTAEVFGDDAAHILRGDEESSAKEWDNSKEFEEWHKQQEELADWQEERETAEQDWRRAQEAEQAAYVRDLLQQRRGERGPGQAEENLGAEAARREQGFIEQQRLDQRRKVGREHLAEKRGRLQLGAGAVPGSLEWVLGSGLRGAGRSLPAAREYLVDNSHLQADAPGIAYRFSKAMEDKDVASLVAPWGTVVEGSTQGDGWVQVGARYLPMEVQGVPVLILQEEREEPERGGGDGGGGGASSHAPRGGDADAPGTAPVLGGEEGDAPDIEGRIEEEHQKIAEEKARTRREEDEAEVAWRAQEEKAAGKKKRALDEVVAKFLQEEATRLRTAETDALPQAALATLPEEEPEDHYAKLGLPRHATAEQIKHAFRELSRLHHPDKKAAAADLDPGAAREGAARMADLNEAHRVLSSPRQRWLYDRSLAAAEETEVRLVATPSQLARKACEPPDQDENAECDFDFSGDGRPFRFARGRAARVSSELGGGARRENLRLALAQLRGQEGMELALRGGVVRHVGPQSPFGGLGEKGTAHRLARPELRSQLRDLVLRRLQEALQSGRGWWDGDGLGLRYVSLGSGQLLFDLELIERIRGLGIRISTVCLVDTAYRSPTVDCRRALREFADWQRAAAKMAKHAPAEVLAFPSLADFYQEASVGGRAAGCHVLVHVEAQWRGAWDDCRRLALHCLGPGGLLVRLGRNGEESAGGPTNGPFNADEQVGAKAREAVGTREAEEEEEDEDEDEEEEDEEEEDDDDEVEVGDSQVDLIATAYELEDPKSGKLPCLKPLQAPSLGASESTSSPPRQAADGGPPRSDGGWSPTAAGGDCTPEKQRQGLQKWRVVHQPRVAVRAQPRAEAEVVDVLAIGDEVVAMGEMEGPWLQLSRASWPTAADAPPEAWVLSDGASIGLGALLERVPCV